VAGGERKSFGILITYKRLMQHEVMKPCGRWRERDNHKMWPVESNRP
jgi:hypothetical protein